MQDVFGFVKRNLSEAQRRKSATSGERGAGKGAAALVPAQHWRRPEREQRSDLKRKTSGKLFPSPSLRKSSPGMLLPDNRGVGKELRKLRYFGCDAVARD